MEDTIIGAGEVKPAPIPHPVREDKYDADVYPASCNNAVIDILMPAYGRLELTLNCFKSLYACTQVPFHLIILSADAPDDYGLTDKWAMEKIKRHNNITYCHRRYDWKEGNQFFNLGLKYCRTDYVATVMNSMTVEPMWEIAALQLMKNDPKIGSIGFKCLFPNGLIESAGIGFAGHIPTDLGRDLPGYRCNEIREAECVQWAFALHRRKALEGTLEEGIFNGHVGWDDIDNNLCVKKKGWKIVYCGLGVGIHQPRATRGSNTIDAFLRNQENARTFYKRWGLWKKYLEENKMNVADIMKGETKDELTHTISKIQVLQELLKKEETQIQPLVERALKELGVDPGEYLLEMNPQKNTWVLKPRIPKPEIKEEIKEKVKEEVVA